MKELKTLSAAVVLLGAAALSTQPANAWWGGPGWGDGTGWGDMFGDIDFHAGGGGRGWGRGYGYGYPYYGYGPWGYPGWGGYPYWGGYGYPYGGAPWGYAPAVPAAPSAAESK